MDEIVFNRIIVLLFLAVSVQKDLVTEVVAGTLQNM